MVLKNINMISSVFLASSTIQHITNHSTTTPTIYHNYNHHTPTIGSTRGHRTRGLIRVVFINIHIPIFIFINSGISFAQFSIKSTCSNVSLGIILGLLSRGYSAPKTALIGTFVHGYAADMCLKKKSMESLLISDVINELPNAFKKLEG